MLDFDSILIAYDESVGIVYYPKKGSIKRTEPKHARNLQSVYNDYLNGKLSDDECNSFEQYIERSFNSAKQLPQSSLLSLLERDYLGRLEIMIANDCNLNCKYCYAGGGHYGMTPSHMNPADVEKYLDALLVGKYHSVGNVMFFGGEPTIAPKTIQKICEYFNKNVSNGIFCSMPTFTMVSNGTLIDENLVEIIRRFSIKVTISIDGPKEINDLLRVDHKGNGTFSRIERSISLMKSAGCPPQMIEVTYTSLHKQMGYEKENIRSYLKDYFGIEKILIENCSSTGEDCDLSYSDDSESELEKDTLEIAIGMNQKSFVDIACGAGKNACTLMPNGELYPCHFFVNNNDFRIAEFLEGEFCFDGYADVLLRMTSA